jgi:predicted RNase H-like nuclease (RuvC/YqgF family)
LVYACEVDPSAKPEEKGLKDLNRAIEAIEDRKSAELQIISEQERMIGVLQENLEEARSEGMKQKIREAINEKEITIIDAEKNLANQNEILSRLYAKRDSLESLE